jgi:formylglycine-generating enzyme
MDNVAHRLMRFDRFGLDLARGILREGERDIELRPKTFEVLSYLTQNAGRLVSKQELFDVAWPNVSVTDDSLVQCIRELREGLCDNEHRLIKTVPRRGYLLDTTVALSASWPPATLALPQVSYEFTPSRRGMYQITRMISSYGTRTWCAAAAGLLGVVLAVVVLGQRPTSEPSSDRDSVQPSPQVHAVFKDCDLCPEMVEIPGGAFMMGSPEQEVGRQGSEGPERRVVIERFAIGRFEITIDQFAAFIADTGFAAGALCQSYIFDARPSEWPLIKASFQYPGFRAGGRHPAVCVSWHDATAYVAWLVQKTGRPYRLPSEAEWEFAARAGTTTAFSFGADLKQLCDFARFADWDSRFPWRGGCHSGAFEPGAFPVGSLAPNAWGLFDMHGNAWEWTQDCWTSDGRMLPSNGQPHQKADNCESRGVRGGGWAAQPQRTRSAQRFRQPSTARNYHIGFRVAR